MSTWKGLEIPEGWHVYRDAGTHACLTNKAGDVQTLCAETSYVHHVCGAMGSVLVSAPSNRPCRWCGKTFISHHQEAL